MNIDNPGSTAYVQHLVQTKDIENIALNLNFGNVQYEFKN